MALNVVVAEEIPVMFSCHPRTAERLKRLPEYEQLAGRGDVRMLDPLGYLDFAHPVDLADVLDVDHRHIEITPTPGRHPDFVRGADRRLR